MVTTKDLLQSPQANISNALGGRIPGLLSVQRSGETGARHVYVAYTWCRYFRSDAESQNPLIMVDGIEVNNLNDIDPNEVESLSILKDASATAVYGVRGANGVILITTKRGELGKPKISFSTNVAITNFPFLPEPMNSYEYARAYMRLRLTIIILSYRIFHVTRRKLSKHIEPVLTLCFIQISIGMIIC